MNGPQQPQGIDLVGIFMAAQQFKRNQQQMDMERQQFDMGLAAHQAEREGAAQKQKALADYYQGNQAPLQMADPALHSKLQQDRAAQEKAQREGEAAQLDMSQKRQDNTTRLYSQMVNQVATHPEHAAQFQDTINKLAESKQIDHFWIPTPEELPEAQQRLGVMRSTATPQTDKQTSLMQNVIAATGFRPGTPQFQAAMKKAMEEEAKRGSVNVTMPGNAEATAGTRKAQEEELLSAYDGVEMLQEMNKIAADPATGKPNFEQFLGLVPRGKKFLLSNLEEIDPSLVPEAQRPWLENMSKFRTIVDEYKAGRYNKLLGSAQSASEVRNLAMAVLNADMGSTQFIAAKARMEQVLARKIAVAEQVLGEGIPLGSIQYRRRYAELEGRQPRQEQSGPGGRQQPPQQMAAPPPDAARLFDELTRQGMPKEQAAQEVKRQMGGG